MKNLIFIGLLFLFGGIAEAKTATLYCRSDTHTINGLTANQLAIVPSSSSQNITAGFGGMINFPEAPPTSANFYISAIAIRHVDGSETVLDSGSLALTTRTVTSGVSGGVNNAPYSISMFTLVPTDALKITLTVYRTYVPNSPNTVSMTFVSNQLGWTKLNTATWIVYRYERVQSMLTGWNGYRGSFISVGALYWGDSTYTTYISGIDYTGKDGGYAIIY